MKQLMTTIVLSALALGVAARTVSVRKFPLLRTSHVRTCSDAKLAINGNSMAFNGLPASNSDIYIMDQQGNVERSGSVSSSNNTIDISALPKGSHLVALKQGGIVKMFGYCSGVEVTAAK